MILCLSDRHKDIVKEAIKHLECGYKDVFTARWYSKDKVMENKLYHRDEKGQLIVHNDSFVPILEWRVKELIAKANKNLNSTYDYY